MTGSAGAGARAGSRWQIGNRAADRVHLPLDLFFAGAALGNQLIEPAVELGDERDQLARRLRLALVAPGCVSGTQGGDLAQLGCKVVESCMQLLKLFVDRRLRRLLRKRQRLLELGPAPRCIIAMVVGLGVFPFRAQVGSIRLGQIMMTSSGRPELVRGGGRG